MEHNESQDSPDQTQITTEANAPQETSGLNPVLSEIHESLLSHFNSAKANIEELMQLVVKTSEAKLKQEGVSIFMKLQHVLDDLGIAVSILRPKTYKNILSNLLKKTIGNLTSIESVIEEVKVQTDDAKPVAKMFSDQLIPMTTHMESYGLFNNEVLTAEGIIRGCFANRERAKYPKFASKYWKNIKFCSSIKDADTLIRRIRKEIPNSELKFNQEQIRLHELKDFYAHAANDPTKDRIDKNQYLMTLKNCKWFGPYKLEAGDFFYFYSIDDTGKNEYFVDFVVYLHQSPCLFLYYHKCTDLIAQYKYFYNK